MMKILLISTNREMLPMPVMPIGVAYLAGVLRDNGYEVAILDLCFEKAVDNSICAKIKSFNPEIIGLSLRNLDNSTAFGNRSCLDELKQLVETIKDITAATIIIGGSGFSSSPKPLLQYLNLEYGIVGEGEYSLLDFVRFFADKDKLRTIPGLVYRLADKIELNSGTEYLKLDELPQPAWDLIDCKRYMRHGGYGAIQTKRGCAFNCIYCSYPVIEGKRYRLRSPELVVDEIEQLHRQYGINYFFFVDSVFSFPYAHAKAICRELIKRKLKVAWEAMTNPRGIDETLVKLMKQSGCIGVEVGIDSASATMLEHLGKSFTQEDIRHSAQLYHKYDIPFSLYLLIGGTHETEQTIADSISLLDTIKQPNQLLMNFGIRIYAGTPLAEQAKLAGLIADEAELLYPKVYISDELPNDMFPILDEYCRHRLHWSNATDWNSPISGMMMRLAQLLQLRPFWKRSKLLGWARKLKITSTASKLYKQGQQKPTND